MKIYQPTPQEAAERAEDVQKLNRIVWLDTYPNETVGITKEDVELKYTDMTARVQKARNSFLAQEQLVWFAEVEGTLVGYSYLKKIEDWYKITSVYIDPKYQGQGIGKALMTEIMNVVGDGKCFLECARHNTKAIGFYERYGFEETDEELQDYTLSNGKTFPVVRMVRVDGA